MNDFETNFPELKGKECNNFDKNKFSVREGITKLYEEKKIQKHCLSKQRVIDAIFLCTIGNSNNIDRVRFLEELRL